MKRLIIVAASAAMLVVTPSALAATTPVTSLSGDWATSNSSLRLTPDGVNFGIYPDASSGGTLIYKGMNGKTLADIKQLSYTFRYTDATDGITTAAPYMRIFFDNGEDAILDPSMCATVKVAQKTLLTYEMTDAANTVRYGDDACLPGQTTWAGVMAEHGSDVITGIMVTQGYAGGTAFSADVTKLGVNGTDFVFGAMQQGPAGSNGTNGVNGTDGQNGSNGATGNTGPAGPAGVNTTTIVTVTKPRRLVGNTLRVLHASPRKGAKLVSVKASLRGKQIKVKDRTVTVNLTGKSVGHYHVVIRAQWSKNGKLHSYREVRNLSVPSA